MACMVGLIVAVMSFRCAVRCVSAICDIRQAKTIIIILIDFPCRQKWISKSCRDMPLLWTICSFQQQKEIASTHRHEKNELSIICRKLDDRRYTRSAYGEIKEHYIIFGEINIYVWYYCWCYGLSGLELAKLTFTFDIIVDVMVCQG